MSKKVGEKLEKELKNLKEYIALATVSAKDYQKTNLEIIKHLTDKENIPGVYITLNKPFKTIEKLFKDKNIDTRIIIFIDAVTKTVGGEIRKTANCLFIGSPEDLSDISIAMDQAVTAIPSKEKFVFFDSLNTLLIYNQASTVARFIHFLASKMRVWKVRGIIVSLQKEKSKELIDELMQFCDVTLDFRGD
jgi:KaiC/GvpD/RAD55 family RecA-like ATPase